MKKRFNQNTKLIFTTLLILLICMVSINVGIDSTTGNLVWRPSFNWFRKVTPIKRITPTDKTTTISPTKSIIVAPIKPTTTCKDFDGGDSFTKSYVKYNNRKYEDYCVQKVGTRTGSSFLSRFRISYSYSKVSSCTGNDCYVNEYVCSNDKVSYKRINCEKGCSNGACIIKTQIPEICKDNDGYCPWECNDYELDNDCGTPKIYDLTFKDLDYLGDMVYFSDTDWVNYQPLKNKVNEIIYGLNTDYEKAVAIANWVKGSKKYDNQNSPANQKHASVIEIFNSDTGICLDAAILTTAMFRLAGIPARAIAPNNAWHEFTEAYISGKWIGFDSTFGSGNSAIIDPVTSLTFVKNFLYKRDKMKESHPDFDYYIQDISVYEGYLIRRPIYKGNAKVQVDWEIKDGSDNKICIVYNPVPFYEIENSPFIFDAEAEKYTIICRSDNNEGKIFFSVTDDKINILKDETSDKVIINIKLISSDINEAGWGSLYVPHTSNLIFEGFDSKYSLTYDPKNYKEERVVSWEIKSNNLDCNFYECQYTDDKNYNIQSVGLSYTGHHIFYGEKYIDGDMYRVINGFIKTNLPEGKYKINYIVPWIGNVAYKNFEINPDTTVKIYPKDLIKYEGVDQDLFNKIIYLLEHNTKGLMI